MHKLVEDKADLLIDKIIKAEIYRLSGELFACCLRQHGLTARTLDTGTFMQMNLERKPDIPTFRNLSDSISMRIGILTFSSLLFPYAKNVYGEIDFMNEKRNDYYATVLASIFEADEIILSTELTNIYTNRNCAREQHSLTYTEAEQLINSGVHLIYTDCITLAARSNIVIRLIDTHDLKQNGSTSLPMIRKAVLKPLLSKTQ